MQPDSEATLIDCFAGTAEAGDYLGISHQLFKLERGSQLTYARLHREAASGQHLGVVEAAVGRDARLRLQALASTPTDAGTEQPRTRLRNGFYVRLEGTGAECIGRGAFAAAGQQHIDYHFTLDHQGDHGRSDILMQAMATAKSRGVINGRIHIAANTRANDGHFTSHNLLLSADAEIDAKPELEIYADEVKCAHGATVGQLDDEQLLYLQTRGIDHPTAVTLLIEGFLKAGLLEWSQPELDEFFQQQLLAALHDYGGC
jgi:Fe-S cluster assembly protein SufD